MIQPHGVSLESLSDEAAMAAPAATAAAVFTPADVVLGVVGCGAVTVTVDGAAGAVTVVVVVTVGGVTVTVGVVTVTVGVDTVGVDTVGVDTVGVVTVGVVTVGVDAVAAVDDPAIASEIACVTGTVDVTRVPLPADPPHPASAPTATSASTAAPSGLRRCDPPAWLRTGNGFIGSLPGVAVSSNASAAAHDSTPPSPGDSGAVSSTRADHRGGGACKARRPGLSRPTRRSPPPRPPRAACSRARASRPR